MNISISTSNKGNYILLSIWDVVNEEEILTFDKQFKTEEEIDDFKETKLFKAVFNSIFKLKSSK
jgi:hypothetical protein